MTNKQLQFYIGLGAVTGGDIKRIKKMIKG